MTGRRGLAIIVAGPDGAGKSALADALVERLGGEWRVRRYHHRAPILPRRSLSMVPVKEPHAKPRYSPLLSLAKVVWLAVDMQVMWRRMVPRLRNAGTDVVVERGWWDLVVDPRRYRLHPHRLTTWLGRRLPAPDLEVILGGPAEVLAARKAELPMDELERQLEMWRALRPAGRRVLHLDARQSIERSAEAVMERIAILPTGAKTRVAGEGAGWAHLPPWSASPRWHVPRGPRAMTLAGLRVYHPVTARAALGWRLVRALASLGGFRLLPAHGAPQIADVVADALPDDTVMAVSGTRRHERAAILALDPTGRPIAVAKIARDAAGRAELVMEGDIGERLRHALPAPLSGPPLLARGDGYLLFAAVDWVHRPKAWELPEEVARAMGTFFRAGWTPGKDGGFTHGDFAPWNLLRTAGGWSLIDWADARVDGPPFFDPLHYLVQSHALLGRPSTRELIDGLYGRGPLGRILCAYADAAGLDMAEAPARMEAYLDASERRLVPGDDEARGRRARAELRLRVTPDSRP